MIQWIRTSGLSIKNSLSPPCQERPLTEEQRRSEEEEKQRRRREEKERRRFEEEECRRYEAECTEEQRRRSEEQRRPYKEQRQRYKEEERQQRRHHRGGRERWGECPTAAPFPELEGQGEWRRSAMVTQRKSFGKFCCQRCRNRPGANPGAIRCFFESTPIQMPPESGGICGRLN